jgi:4-oxalomesaconate tautomerase
MEILLRLDPNAPGGLGECSFLRTARKLFDGHVFDN